MGTQFTVTESIVIHRPVEEVFAYAADLRNDVTWRDGVIAMNVLPDAPIRAGTRTVEVLRAYGRQIITEAIVTEVVPDQRFDFQSTAGPIKISGFRKFEPVEGGTRVTYAYCGALDALFSVAWPVLRISAQRKLAGDLQRLQTRIEVGRLVPALELGPVFDN